MVRVLLIEDNPGDVLLARELLASSTVMAEQYDILHVDRVHAAVALLSGEHSIDIILSDMNLPDSTGDETITKLSTVALNLPIIFMTSINDEAVAITALNHGAQDYIVKGQAGGDELARVLLYSIERKKNQNQMSQIRAESEVTQQKMALLSRQKKELVALNKSKDEFISIASHQLRTPATAVKQYLAMVLDGYLGDVDDKQRKALQVAYDSNERQMSIIKELLKTAQIDSNKVTIKPERTNIAILVDDLIHKHATTFKMRSQTIVFEPTDAYDAVIDKAEISLVIENVIENASKYTPPHKRICITLSKTAKKIIIKVSDEGVGISAEDTKKIFEKFTRVDNSMSDTVSGTGLGLYWVKKILKLHKGTIAVESELGKGSTFTIGIPV